MKLKISKSKFPDAFGSKINFTVSATVVLSEEDKKMLLDLNAIKILVLREPKKITIMDLMRTSSFTSTDVVEALAFESDITQACESFYPLLQSLRGYVDTYEIDIEKEWVQDQGLDSE